MVENAVLVLWLLVDSSHKLFYISLGLPDGFRGTEKIQKSRRSYDVPYGRPNTRPYCLPNHPVDPLDLVFAPVESTGKSQSTGLNMRSALTTPSQTLFRNVEICILLEISNRM